MGIDAIPTADKDMLPSTDAAARDAARRAVVPLARARDSYVMPEAARRFVATLEARSRGYAVRGALTAAVLRREGFQKARVLGCPSLFIHPSPRLGALLSARHATLAAKVRVTRRC